MGERFEARRNGYGWTVFDTTTRAAVTGEFSSMFIAENKADALNHEAKKKKRPCLRCRAPFMSEGPHNRLCPSCRTGSDPLDWMSGLIG